MNPRTPALALVVAFLAVPLIALVPTASAHHGCDPHVSLDPTHTPPGVWSNHNSPSFNWAAWSCNVYYYQIQPSWGGSISTSATGFHPTLPDGVHSIAVRTVYTWTHYHEHDHCHTWVFGRCYSWHRHYDPHTHYDGSSNSVNSPQVMIDTVPPTASLSWSSPRLDSNGEWVTSAASFQVAAADSRSGIASISATVDGQSVHPASFSITGADGLHTVSYHALDRAGNQFAGAQDILLDNTAPTTAIAVDGPSYLSPEGDLWVNDATTFALAANDGAGVGVASTRFAIGDGTEQAYVEPFTLPVDSAEESRTIRFWSIDRLGNAEAARTIVVRTDTTAPEQRLESHSPQSLTLEGASFEPCSAAVFRLGGKPAGDALGESVPPMPDAPEAPALPDAPELPGLPAADPAADALAGFCAGHAAVPPQDAEMPVEAPDVLDAPDAPEAPAVLDIAVVRVSAGTVAVRVNATDVGSGVERVEFWVDGALRHADPDAAYEWLWDTGNETAGEHFLEVRAFDNLGHEAAPLGIVVTTAPLGAGGIVATAERATGADVPDAPAPPEVPELPETPPAPELPPGPEELPEPPTLP